MRPAPMGAAARAPAPRGRAAVGRACAWNEAFPWTRSQRGAEWQGPSGALPQALSRPPAALCGAGRAHVRGMVYSMHPKAPHHRSYIHIRVPMVSQLRPAQDAICIDALSEPGARREGRRAGGGAVSKT
eukprot:scaffold2157_cov376-Prasinococcus_capsulatus_cf.AAC.6